MQYYDDAFTGDKSIYQVTKVIRQILDEVSKHKCSLHPKLVYPS